MVVDGNYKCFKYFFTKEHVLACWVLGGTPFQAYDKAANQDMYDFIVLTYGRTSGKEPVYLSIWTPVTCAAVQKST